MSTSFQVTGRTPSGKSWRIDMETLVRTGGTTKNAQDPGGRMTLEQLIAVVPVHRDRRSHLMVVAMSEIPRPWAEQCFIALAGRPMAGTVDPYGPCIFAEDWFRWVRGELAFGPMGLEAGPEKKESAHGLAEG